MRLLRDYFETLAPGGFGFGIITLTDIKDIAAIGVAFVSIVCTILVTARKLRKE